MKNKELEIVTLSKAKFDKLSQSQKQMAVAQDVIDRVQMGQLYPSTNAFCTGFIETNKTQEKPQLSEKLKSLDTQCSVCAKGGLFMAYIGIVNSYKIDFLGLKLIRVDGAKLESKEMMMLSVIFSQKQLSLIEAAFEGVLYNWNVELSDKEIYACKDFCDSYYNEGERLIAICENIIKNKGTFIP